MVSGENSDNGELDAVFVEAVDQCCFRKSSSRGVHASSGRKIPVDAMDKINQAKPHTHEN